MKKAALGQKGFSPIHGDPVAIATRWCYLLMGVGEASGGGTGEVMANYTVLYESNSKTLTSSSTAPAGLISRGVPKYPEQDTSGQPRGHLSSSLKHLIVESLSHVQLFNLAGHGFMHL